MLFILPNIIGSVFLIETNYLGTYISKQEKMSDEINQICLHANKIVMVNYQEVVSRDANLP